MRQRRVLLIAADVGITPIRALLDELPFQPDEAMLLYRVSERATAVFRAELEELADCRGVHLWHPPRLAQPTHLLVAGTASRIRSRPPSAARDR